MAKSLIGKVFNQGPPVGGWRSRSGGYQHGAGAGNNRTSFLNSMSTQGTLFAIIQLLSTGKHATGPWSLYKKSTDKRVRYASTDRGSDQRTEILQHQALRLWNRPNPFMTGSDFREIGWQHMELTGEWYWVLNRGPSGMGVPVEMWPVSPDRMEPVPDRDEFLKGWVYTSPDGEGVPLLNSEVIQLRYPHPTDYYRGISPVQSILADIDSARYTAEYTRNFFLNSAQPGGIVTFNKRLTDEEFTEFTDRWREQHQGVARGHRVGVLEQGASWESTTMSLKDMELPELRRVLSDSLRQAYRIHQAMLGNSDDVNRANAQTALEIHIAFHEIPRLEREKNVLNTRFLEMFGAEETIEFDYPDPMPENREQDNIELKTKSEAWAALVAAGADPHAALECVGLPDMDMVPPALQSPEAEPPDGPPNPTGEPGEASQEPSESPAAPAGQSPSALAGLDYLWEDTERIGLGPLLQEAFAQARGSNNGHKEKV